MSQARLQTSLRVILLEASGTITLNSGATWDLSGSTGKTSGQLTLEAGGSITLNNGSSIVDANDWSITLEAGYNFASGSWSRSRS